MEGVICNVVFVCMASFSQVRSIGPRTLICESKCLGADASPTEMVQSSRVEENPSSTICATELQIQRAILHSEALYFSSLSAVGSSFVQPEA